MRYFLLINLLLTISACNHLELDNSFYHNTHTIISDNNSYNSLYQELTLTNKIFSLLTSNSYNGVIILNDGRSIPFNNETTSKMKITGSYIMTTNFKLIYCSNNTTPITINKEGYNTLLTLFQKEFITWTTSKIGGNGQWKNIPINEPLYIIVKQRNKFLEIFYAQKSTTEPSTYIVFSPISEFKTQIGGSYSLFTKYSLFY